MRISLFLLVLMGILQINCSQKNEPATFSTTDEITSSNSLLSKDFATDSIYLNYLSDFDCDSETIATNEFLIRLLLINIGGDNINSLFTVRILSSDSIFTIDYREINPLYYGMVDTPVVRYRRSILNGAPQYYPIDSMKSCLKIIDFFNLSLLDSSGHNYPSLFNYYLEVYDNGEYNLIHRFGRINEIEEYEIGFESFTRVLINCVGLNTEYIKNIILNKSSLQTNEF